MENVLMLRKRLSMFEAAGLLSGNRQQIVELMREAIEAGELSAVEVVRHGDYSVDNGGWLPGGPINYMQTIIERAEFERWFDATGLTKPLTAPAQAPVVTATDSPTPAAPNWKMRIQAEATELVLRLRKSGSQPNRHSILDSMATWCRENQVKTDSGIFPSANYLRTHVLASLHWSMPD